MFVFSVITHLRDKEDFLDWLDDRVKHMLIFESNHGEPNKKHIELVKKHIWAQEVRYLGPSDIPEKPHYMWVVKKHPLEVKYPGISKLPIEFFPLDRITIEGEDVVMNQDESYPLDSDKFRALVADIKERGIRDPILIRKCRGGVYKIKQGVHRYYAAKQLRYKDIPCRIFT